MKCIKGHNVQVLNSIEYYIGTIDEDGLPYCRISKLYYSTKEAAEEALKNTFIIRDCIENDFCNEGKRCL